MSESPEVSQQSEAPQGGKVASTVERMARELRDLASAAEEEAVAQLHAATARVDSESTQTDILQALLEEGRRFASRTAFFLTRPGEIRGWAGRGFGESSIEGLRLGYEDGSVWARLATGAGTVILDADDCSAVCRSLDVPAGRQGVLIPFVLRGQLGGALYADRLGGGGPPGIASLQLLTHSAAQSIETAAGRGGSSSPTLHLSSEAAAEGRSVSLWQGVEEKAATPDTSAVAAAAGAVATAAATVEPEETAAPVAEEPSPVEEPPAEPVAEAISAAKAPVEEEPAAEKAAEATASEAVDFEMVSTAEGEDSVPPPVDTEVSEEELAEAEVAPEPELEDTGGDIWIAEEEEETVVGPAPVEAPEVETPLPPPVGQETVRLDIASLQSQMPAAGASEPQAGAVSKEETANLPQWDVEPLPESATPDFELEPEEGPELEPVEPEPKEPLTAPVARPKFSAPVDSEDATIISPRVDPEPPPSPMDGGYVPPPVEEAPPPVSKPEATGTTQVIPPTDVQGPGSAFGLSEDGIPAGEEALHEEARRLARLLVSEIKLYNEEIIEEGRRAGNVYDRLKEDIDRSRQMYEERIDPRLREVGVDYFRQELVQRLAGGDDRVLGY